MTLKQAKGYCKDSVQSSLFPPVGPSCCCAAGIGFLYKSLQADSAHMLESPQCPGFVHPMFPVKHRQERLVIGLEAALRAHGVPSCSHHVIHVEVQGWHNILKSMGL